MRSNAPTDDFIDYFLFFKTQVQRQSVLWIGFHGCRLIFIKKETTTESVSTTPRKNDIEVVDLDADSDDDSEADNSEAFNDLEDEDLICSNYVEAPKQKVLPHAVVIGARKGGTRKVFHLIVD